eukprot:138086-Amphidinium_carterae.1
MVKKQWGLSKVGFGTSRFWEAWRSTRVLYVLQGAVSLRLERGYGLKQRSRAQLSYNGTCSEIKALATEIPHTPPEHAP